ncbi:cupin domain-containing protein [Chitinophaga ginsengisoli]|uniref:Quercetin dioxygenase-like cupin family protein n=1 Tax=Chitinophaga ginsengisoli TaxID=363837 RepID=A0A2P8G7M4_9BACT|nr:cupin domain-containing protein [Chitinophaga ginsengisoli]PSL29981.1 quercetin dioxygenase-like cupin family protein [Chitinophaga ginsengisoli]
MKQHNILASAIVAVVMAAALIIPDSASAQLKGLGRKDLQQHDLSIPGREAVQVLVDFKPGVTAPKHSHPGEEIIYVTEGVLEYRLEGKASVTLKTGDVLFIPYGVKHEVKNVGNVEAKELATYIVEKGKPLVVLAK